MTLSTDFAAVRTALDLAQLNASDTELDRDRLARTVADQEVTIALHEQTIAAQAVTIADLEAQLAGGGGGDNPPPPDPSPMLVGATVDARTGENLASALVRFERSIGKRLQGVRRFTPGVPSVSLPAFADVLADTQYKALALSFKSGTQAEIEAFMKALPVVQGRTYYLALYHEPDKKLRIAPADFRAMCARLRAAKQNVQRDDIVLMIVLTSWLERDPNGTVSSAAYFPDEPAEWVLALDPYFPKPENTYASQVGKTVALWRAAGGKRIAIAEFGVQAKGAVAARQITNIANDARADGCEFLDYFDSGVGSQAGPEGWYLDVRGPEAQAAFAAQINP